MNVVISRETLFSKKNLLEFSSSDLKDVHHSYLKISGLIDSEKIRINEKLYHLIQSSSPEKQKLLLNIKRKIFNDKSLSQKDISLLCGENVTIESLIHLKKCFVDHEDLLLNGYNVTEIDLIKSLLSKEDFKLSLFLSSRSLYNQLDKYLNAESYNKKIKKIELNLANYMFRALTKPSPLAAFTNLSATNLNGEDYYIERFHYKINDQFFRMMYDHLKEKYFKDLPLIINPTLHESNEAYKFITFSSGIEEINTIEKNETLEYLKQVVFEKEKSITELLQMLGESGNGEEIELYLKHLLSYGFFEFKPPFSVSETNKIDKFSEYIKNIDVPFKSEFNILSDIFAKLNLEHSLVKHIDIIIEFEKVAEKIITHSDNPISWFDHMGLIYLDSTSPYSKEPLSATDFKRIENIILNFRSIDTRFIHKENLKYKIKEYKELNKTNGDISVIDFYRFFFETFYKDRKEQTKGNELYTNNPLDLDTIESQRLDNDKLSELRKSKLQKNGVNDRQYELDENIDKLEYESASYGIYLQRYKENGKNYYVMNHNLTRGYGQWFSRFTTIFKPEFGQSILKSNEKFSVEKIAMSNSKFFNANIYTPLTSRELRYPHALPNEKSIISIGDLQIREFDRDVSVVLNDKPVDLIHLGFQSIQSLPPLYEMLTWLNTIPDKYISVSDDLITIDEDVKFLPRQVINDLLVVRRKTWYVRFERISKIHSSLELLKLKSDYNLPDRIFYKRIEDKKNKTRSDKATKRFHYKPQYLDFYSPISVRCFLSNLKENSVDIEITEMLPDLENMTDPAVTEFLLQFDKDSPGYLNSHQSDRPQSELELWVSYFIYLPKEKMSQLICELYPIINRFKRLNIPVFYVRYSDHNGDHLRFRYKKTLIDEDFSSSIKEICKNYEIREGFYELEYERYGGKKGKELALELFTETSDLIAQFFIEHNEIRCESLAREFSNVFLDCISGNDQETHAMNVTHYYENYLNLISETPNQELEKIDQELEFEQSHYKQNVHLGKSFVKNVKSLYAKHCQLAPVEEVSDIFKSYIHLTNNKIGLSIRDEVKLFRFLGTHLIEVTK